MSKFTIRFDNVSKLWVTLANTVTDDSIWPQPGCTFTKPGAATTTPAPCCGATELVTCHACAWCRAQSRNLLTLNTSPDLVNWSVRATVMSDDTGFTPWASELYTGFQYVDWQFDGADGDNLIALVRAGYRGSQCGHNANRILFKLVPAWRTLLTIPREARG